MIRPYAMEIRACIEGATPRTPSFLTHTTSQPYTPPSQVIENMGNLHMKIPGILEH
jgi:hypothetical protein